MAPDIVTEVQGKNCTNPEGFTMTILYRWKHLEVYFPMALNSSTFDNPAMGFEYFVKDYSRTAPDFVTEVQGKNCTNPEGFTRVSYTVGSVLKSTLQRYPIRVLWITQQ